MIGQFFNFSFCSGQFDFQGGALRCRRLFSAIQPVLCNHHFSVASYLSLFPLKGDIADWDSYLNFDMDHEVLSYKTLDEFPQDKDFFDLMRRRKIFWTRRFADQAISFYRHFIKILLTDKLATSFFARGLSSFDEAVIKEGNESLYTESGSENWVSFFCYYEVQSRIELFRLFHTCCETPRCSSNAPLLFIVSLPGLKSDNNEFTSASGALNALFLHCVKLKTCFWRPTPYRVSSIC